MYLCKKETQWRKANQIHNWFVQNIQGGFDGGAEYTLSVDDLKELLSTCETVMSDKNRAQELLPTLEGFCYGNYEYDDLYFKQIENTIKKLKVILKDVEFCEKSPEFIYRSYW